MQRRNSDVSDLCLPWLVCSAQNCWWKNGFTVQLGLAVFNLLSRNICLHPLEIRFVLAVTLVWNLDKEGFAQWTMTLAACFKSQPHAGAADVVLKVFFLCILNSAMRHQCVILASLSPPHGCVLDFTSRGGLFTIVPKEITRLLGSVTFIALR